MDKRFFGAVAVGGIVLFVWSFFSWMVLPWHKTTFSKFTSEETVAVALRENAPEPGMYFLPNPHGSEEQTPEEAEAAMKEATERMKTGPFIFASVLPNGTNPDMTAQLILSLLVNWIAAFFVLLLTNRLAGMTFWTSVGAVVLIPTIGYLFANFPLWNWWGFSCHYLGINFLDNTIGWFLAGVAMIKVRG